MSRISFIVANLSGWNFAVVVDAIARDVPDREAVIQGARRMTWQQLASRVRALAWYLHIDVGIEPDDRVAIVVPNCPAYFETFFAARKLHAVPLNVGTGLTADRLHQIVDGSDAKAVVCSPTMASASHAAIRQIPKRWRPSIIELGDQYERGIAAAAPPAEWNIEAPSADDLIFLAAHDVAARRAPSGPRLLPAAPLTLGSNLAAALGVLTRMGTVVLVESPEFDPRMVWLAVEQESVAILTIGGDAFARPLLAALPRNVGDGFLATLRTIASSGARLSPDVARGLEAALAHVKVLDTYEAPEERAPGTKEMINPSDVEAALSKHPSIKDCVVLGVSDPRVGKEVVAMVEVSEGHYLDVPEIAAWCRAHLPSSMTPGRFIFVERIDRSPSGDADYQSLRDFAVDRLMDER